MEQNASSTAVITTDQPPVEIITLDNPISKLTDKQKLFVLAYLTNGSDVRSAVLTAGGSPKNPWAQGQRWMSDPIINEAILYILSTDQKTAKSNIGNSYWKIFKASGDNASTDMQAAAVHLKYGEAITKLFHIDDSGDANKNVTLEDLIKQAKES